MESKIQVAETGNKRSAVSEADIEQAILDINEWFKSNFPSLKSSPGVPSNQIEELKAPDHLKVLLTKHNGGVQL